MTAIIYFKKKLFSKPLTVQFELSDDKELDKEKIVWGSFKTNIL